MGSYVTLHKERALSRVDAARQQGRRRLQSQFFWSFTALLDICLDGGALCRCVVDVLAHVLLGDGVVVDDAEVALEGSGVLDSFLKVDPVFDGAQVVSKVDKSGGLDSTEDNFLDQFVCGSH